MDGPTDGQNPIFDTKDMVFVRPCLKLLLSSVASRHQNSHILTLRLGPRLLYVHCEHVSIVDNYDTLLPRDLEFSKS